MRLEVNIKLDNAAFENDSELPELLRELATRFQYGFMKGDNYPIMDSNGNKVGLAKIIGGSKGKICY